MTPDHLQHRHTEVIGLFAKGSVPSVGLLHSMNVLRTPLRESVPQTAVVVRSRVQRTTGDLHGDDKDKEEVLLSDKIICHVCANDAIIEWGT